MWGLLKTHTLEDSGKRPKGNRLSIHFEGEPSCGSCSKWVRLGTL